LDHGIALIHELMATALGGCDADLFIELGDALPELVQTIDRISHPIVG
jgi:hypothetical protein